MRFGFGQRHRQRGTIAVMVGLLIIPLIAFLGIVIDLGHLYVRKTELQNAADAAALAGVIKLNGQASGIDNAVAAAIASAAANASDLGYTPVAISAAQISFGPTSDGAWSDQATAQASPATMSYIKVDTTGIAQGTRPTWFMAVVSSALASTTAAGMAVAGAPICETLPIFICPPPGGFTRGQSYFFADDPSVVGYFDPVLSGAPPLINGANDMRDIVCTGKTFCIPPGPYRTLTQPAFGTMARALNTRFDDYASLPTNLTPDICRPDTNVKEYLPGQVAWMASPPADQLGVYWSAARPSTLPGEPPVNDSYPSATPYTQTTSTYYAPPTGHENYAQAGRRVITMAIADPSACDATGHYLGSGSGDVPIAAFGRFFMPVKAKGTGNPKGIYVEYLETIMQPLASAPDIKLYR